MKDKKNSPKCPNLRFPEFEGEWEACTLDDLVYVVGGGTPDTNNPKFWNGDIQWFTPSEIGKSKYVLASKRTISEAGLKSSNAKLLPINTILLSTRATIGECSIAKVECCTNQGFQSLIVKDADLDFVYYLTSTRVRNLIKRSSGSTFLEISKKEVEKTACFIPQNKQEQAQIGRLLSIIDQRIGTQIKIIEELESLKKGLQKKMLLPTENSEPSLRLSGYKNKWTKIRLGEICSFYSGGTPNSSMKDLYQGNIPFIRSGEIQKYETELHINKKTLSVSSTKLVSKGDLLLALYGATSGEIAISKISGAINQAILCIRTRYNKLFLKYLWESNVSKILKTYLQGGQGNLSGHIVQNVSFFFPALEEQNQIASFIKYIDDKILLEEKQVEEYRKQKNFLLQNLFI